MPNSVKINCFFSSERIWYWSSSREKNCLGCGLKLKIAEGLYLLIARVGLVYYFAFFLIITPFIGWIEKPKTLPASISDIYLGGGKESPISVSQKEIH